MRSVLFVDDDITSAAYYKEELASRLSVEVEVATSVADASRLMTSKHFDVIVTDLVLEPTGDRADSGLDESGLDVIRAARRRDLDSSVIVLSGFAGNYRDELVRLGVPVIEKGSDPNFFFEAVEKALQRRPAPDTLPEQDSSLLRRQILSLDAIRQIFAEEAAKLLSAKGRTLAVPGQGQFDVLKSLQGFKSDIERQLLRFPFERNVFLMMKFRGTNREVADYIVETLRSASLLGVRADDEQWNITNTVYNPIAVLYCCKYGIALFDEAQETQAYSANVAYELGMMHLQNKSCLILKHSSLPQIPFDLIKDLHVPYDKDLQLRKIVERWVRDTCASQTT